MKSYSQKTKPSEQTTARHFTVKLPEAKDKREELKSRREKPQYLQMSNDTTSCGLVKIMDIKR